MAKKRKETEPASLNLREIILRNKVPLLTLDERWHNLFPEEMKTPRIKELEQRLNDLVKNQGKLNTDMEDLRKLKKKLMDKVIDNMGESTGIAEKIKQRKQEKIQKLILEVNEKLREAEDTLYDRPEQIKRANVDLLMECMRVWYAQLDANNKEIEEIGRWVEMIREKLKEKLLIKQEREMQNAAVYTYMHTLLGPKIMEQIDTSREEKTE